MTGSDYIIQILKKYDITDVFGIPGAVVLDLIYAFDRNGIKPHLCYHEQAAGFAACGYAQAKNSLGVAYATKGPGVTNMITAIADAYYDSVPVLFITAHSMTASSSQMRFMENQEMNVVSMVSHIVKYAEYVETETELLSKVENACAIAMENRKGPVLLDFSSKLLEQAITQNAEQIIQKNTLSKTIAKQAIEIMVQSINASSNPVILIGNGIKQSKHPEILEQFCSNNKIPILSSRTALDCFAYSDAYFGYVGSRGLRYANFILSKCDLIVSIGNRMAYAPKSKSFQDIMSDKQVLRLEIDENEFERHIPNSIDIKCDLADVIEGLKHVKVQYSNPQCWIQTCVKLRKELYDYDMNNPVRKMAGILQLLPQNITIVSDVGNNALWLSRTHNYLKLKNRVLFSMGLSCLGNALCKSIGVFFAERQFAICIIGDQGLQMNIQELEFISSNKIPIFIILINNHSSGMIKNWENQKYGYDLHSSPENGYEVPDFQKITYAYGINYVSFSGQESVLKALDYCVNGTPVLLDVLINPSDKVLPSLQRGAPCCQMTPELPPELYEVLSEL